MNQLRQLTKQSGVGHGSNGGGRKFFASTSRGEISELAADLNSNDRTKERYAIKRIIATMTLGRDVSRLFPDVVKLSRTTNLEIKKLVYLYIVTNARLASDKAILAVNTFVQDAQYDHPAIRALALRTMLCLRVEGITDYTIPPLRKALRDVDPYVRRTAAIGLGKFYHQSPHLFEQQNFFVEAISLISDASPMVVAAAACTVDEILQSSPNSTRVDEIQITDTLVRKMLTALPECVEWGQCRILALVSHHCPKNHTDAESLIERLLLLLSHTSVCIVLAVGKVVINLLERVALNSPVRAQVLSKVSNAYVTLLGLGGETISAALQYVVCRDVYILNYKYPAMFVPHIRSFLIRFNDPTYLKLEKLNIMIRLLTTKNTAYVTAELIQYSNDLDVAFVSAVIRAFGVVALVDDIQVGACIEHLFAIASRGGTMRYNEVICVLKDILRRYPQHHDLILPKIFGTSVTSIGFALESLIENTEALQAGLWMLGEFNMHIEHAPTVLGNFLAAVDVLHLGTNAQLTLLTTTVKVFNSHPAAMEQLICSLLDHFIMNAVCPDVQERAILYYRLLSHESGAQILSKVVMGVLPVVSPDSDAIDPMRLNDFIRNLNSVASVIRQPPEVFVPKYGLPAAHESYQTDSFDESGELSCEEPHFIIGTSGESDASVGLGNRASHDEGNSINISSTLLGSNDNPVHPSLNGSRQANTSSNEKNLQPLAISDTKNDVPTNRDDTFDAQRRAQISTLDVLDDIFGGSSTPSSSHNMTTNTKALKSGHETRIRGTPQNLDELFSSETPSTGLVVGSTTATTDDSPKGVDSLGSCNSPSLPVILRSSHIPGFYIQGGLVDVGTSFAMGLELHFYYVYDDSTMAPPPCALKDFGIQVNRNALGLKTISPLQASMPAELLPMPCQPHSSTPSARHRTTVALQFVEAHFDRSGSFSELQVALKTNLGVDYFVVSVPIALVYRPLTEFSKKAYMNVWKSLDVQKEKRIRIPLPPTHGAPGFHTWLEAHVKQTFRAIVVSERSTPLQVHFYLALETHGGDYVLVELVFLKEDAANCFACIKAKEAEVQARILESLLNVVFTCPASGKIDHS